MNTNGESADATTETAMAPEPPAGSDYAFLAHGPLSPVEARVLGSLIEKEMTTPEYYPLTLNSLTTACNQKSNRDPLMTLTEAAVGEALDNLRYERHLVSRVMASGSRAPKFRHELFTLLPLPPAERAVLCELLIRGPQTPGELRNRAGRLLVQFTPELVDQALQGLESRTEGPLVRRQARQPGQREARYTHLLCGDADTPAAEAASVSTAAHDADRLAVLEQQVAELSRRLAAVENRLNAAGK